MGVPKARSFTDRKGDTHRRHDLAVVVDVVTFFVESFVAARIYGFSK